MTRLYLSLSTTTVVFGAWVSGLLLSSAGRLPISKEGLFFSVSTAIAVETGSRLGARRALGDRLLIFAELLGCLVATVAGLFAAWIGAEIAR